jgi:hypothetical protein
VHTNILFYSSNYGVIGVVLTVFVTLRSPRLLLLLILLSLLWIYGLFVYRPAAQLGGRAGGASTKTRVATLGAISAFLLWASGAMLAPLWAAAWTLLITFAHAALRPVSMKASAGKMASDVWSAIGGARGDDRGNPWQQTQERSGNRSGSGSAAASPHWNETEGFDRESAPAALNNQTFDAFTQPNLRARANFTQPAAPPAALPRPGVQTASHHNQTFMPPAGPYSGGSQQYTRPAPPSSLAAPLPRPGDEKRRD